MQNKKATIISFDGSGVLRINNGDNIKKVKQNLRSLLCLKKAYKTIARLAMKKLYNPIAYITLLTNKNKTDVLCCSYISTGEKDVLSFIMKNKLYESGMTQLSPSILSPDIAIKATTMDMKMYI